MSLVHGHCHCHCHNVQFTMSFSQTLAQVHPRRCQCDYCTAHQAAYISDPLGTLEITIHCNDLIEKQQQGSNTAEFLVCQKCGDLIGVMYRSQQKLFAAINARLCNSAFGEEASVSPMHLSPTDKVKRWTEVWFSQVTINNI